MGSVSQKPLRSGCRCQGSTTNFYWRGCGARRRRLGEIGGLLRVGAIGGNLGLGCHEKLPALLHVGGGLAAIDKLTDSGS